MRRLEGNTYLGKDSWDHIWDRIRAPLENQLDEDLYYQIHTSAQAKLIARVYDQLSVQIFEQLQMPVKRQLWYESHE